MAAVAEDIDALVKLVRGPITPDLESRIEAAAARRPRDIRLKFAQSDLWAKTGRADQALATLRELHKAHDDNPWVALRLANLLRSKGDARAAAGIFAENLWKSDLPEAAIVNALSEITTSLSGFADRRSFLMRLLSGRAVDRFAMVKLGSLAFREGERAEAMRLFDQATAMGPLPPEAEPLQLELLIVSGRAEEALKVAIAMLRTRPNRPDIVRRAIHAARLCRRTDVLVELLQRALDRWPNDWLLVFRYNRALCPFDVDRILFTRLGESAEEMSGDDRWSFQFALACLRHAQTARALKILRRIGPESSVAHMALPLLAAMSSRPDSAWTNPRRISNDPADDVQIVRAADARATFIVLAGVQGGLGYLPYSHADVLLADFPANVIYLRDRRELAFTGGVAGLGADESQTVSRLKDILLELGGVPAFTMGTSLGGASAVRMGCLVGAKAAISFAGPLQWNSAADEDESELSRTGLRNAMFSAFTQVETSLVDLIARSAETEVHHCYGEDCKIDVEVVERSRRLPNFHRHAIAGCDHHFVMSHMIASGAFDQFLREAIGL